MHSRNTYLCRKAGGQLSISRALWKSAPYYPHCYLSLVVQREGSSLPCTHWVCAATIVSSPSPTGPDWRHEILNLGLGLVLAQASAELNFRNGRKPQVCRQLLGKGRLFTGVMEHIFVIQRFLKRVAGEKNPSKNLLWKPTKPDQRAFFAAPPI